MSQGLHGDVRRHSQRLRSLRSIYSQHSQQVCIGSAPDIHNIAHTFTVSEKNSGPKTDPCGTAKSELSVVDVALPTLTKHERPS